MSRREVHVTNLKIDGVTMDLIELSREENDSETSVRYVCTPNQAKSGRVSSLKNGRTRHDRY